MGCPNVEGSKKVTHIFWGMSEPKMMEGWDRSSNFLGGHRKGEGVCRPVPGQVLAEQYPPEIQAV